MKPPSDIIPLLSDFLQARGASRRLIARLSHAHMIKEAKPFITDLTTMPLEEFLEKWTPEKLHQKVRGFGKMAQKELQAILGGLVKRCPCCGQIVTPNKKQA